MVKDVDEGERGKEANEDSRGQGSKGRKTEQGAGTWVVDQWEGIEIGKKVRNMSSRKGQNIDS